MGFFDSIKKKISSPKAKEEKRAKEEKPARLASQAKKAEVKAVVKKEAPVTLKPKAESAGKIVAKETKEVKAKKAKDDTKDAYKILIKPMVTEKATQLATLNKYCFQVALNANKIEIKKAITSLYGVLPIDVNIVRQKGKTVSYRRMEGKKKNWKKAIVTLKPNEKIEIYEGV